MQASVQRFKNPTITEYYSLQRALYRQANLQPRESLGGDVGFLFETHDNRHSLDVGLISLAT